MIKRSIFNKIKEGKQKRQEEYRRLQDLRKELKQYKTQSSSKFFRDPVAYIPNIFVTLLFTSLPLSEQVVDWQLVAFFFACNIIVSLATSPSLWNILSLVTLNLFLIQFSGSFGDIPALLAQIDYRLVLQIIFLNAAAGSLICFLYAKHRFLFMEEVMPSLEGVEKDEAAELAKFFAQRNLVNRIDIIGCILILFNVFLLALFGVIAPGSVMHSLQSILYIFG